MEENKAYDITSSEIYDYCKTMSSKLPAALKEIEIITATIGQEIMLSGPFLGNYLMMISKVLRPKYILEVGAFTGYGTVCLGLGLQDGGKIVTIEKNAELKDISLSVFKELDLHHKVIQMIGDASDIIDKLDYSFDLVFLDAAKRKYVEHYEMIMSKLNSGGVILADNVLWKGTILSDNVDKLGQGLDEFNKHVKADPRVENILLPIDDGLHFIRKK